MSAAQSAVIAPSREAAGVVPDSLSRPTDILLPTWSRGCPAALDVHVISTIQQHPSRSISHPWTRSSSAQAGFPSGCLQISGVEFVPVVAKTLGGLADDTIQTIKVIGRAISQTTSSSSSSSSSSFSTTQLFYHFAISVWRGNACLWLHHQPPLPRTVDGILRHFSVVSVL